MTLHIKKLYRSNQDYKLAGVCGGISEYFGIDAVLIRLGWIPFTFLAGSGIIAYLIAWAVIPKRPLSNSGLEGKAKGKY